MTPCDALWYTGSAKTAYIISDIDRVQGQSTVPRIPHTRIATVCNVSLNSKPRELDRSVFNSPSYQPGASKTIPTDFYNEKADFHSAMVAG